MPPSAGTLTVRAAAAAAPPLTARARAGFWTLVGAHVLSAWGTQWDIQWHLRIGRDSFWIAPHVMTYSGVTLMVLVSWGLLAWTSWRTLHGRAERGWLRVAGITGTRGWHLAAWAIALTVLAAPIDDLWHRLFGLDVTLWSPPHLLGLLGAVLNAMAGWLVAREAYPAAGRGRVVATIVAGGLVAGGISVGLGPGVRMAYTYGGVRFFTYAMLAALLLPLALVVVTRLSRVRVAPLLALLVMVAVGFTGSLVARAGFAWLAPVSYIEAEIARDPASPIAIAHEVARKNGVRPGAFSPRALLVTLVAALVMLGMDARRRPVAAALAFGVTVFVGLGVLLARQPAFAAALPSPLETAAALALTLLAGAGGGVLAVRVHAALERLAPER